MTQNNTKMNHSQGERAILEASQSISNKRDMGNPDTSFSNPNVRYK